MEKSFTMQASAHAFSVLSKSLYKNEILAIIRELSSNAQDAHTEAGVEEPFYLHLPTNEERFFLIRDFGTGISEDLIYDVYTSFFLSTKTDVEDQIGAFGLGSKTPFSLVDKYFVTSYCDGRKKVYKMEKVDGLPTVEKVSDEPQGSEKNGLEIKFDINPTSYYYDWDKWTTEAFSFFQGATFLPNVNTFGSNINWEEFARLKEFYTNDNITFGSCYRPELTVNVAGVKFRVDYNDLNLSELSSAGVDKMNIMAGKMDVTITPSREALHFDQKTIEFIKNKVNSLLTEYFQKINDNFDSLSFKEAVSLYNNQKYDNELNKKIRNKIENLFFDKKLASRHSGRGVHLDTSYLMNSLGNNSYYYRNPKYVLVDVSGIKTTVKQNVVDNFYNHQTFDDKGRLSSTSFANVIKAMSDEDAVFLFPKTKDDFEKCKTFFGNEGVIVKKWSDYCDLKKEASGRRMGFKTRSTILIKQDKPNAFYNTTYFYGNNPDLEDDEIGLIFEENTEYNPWLSLIRGLVPSFKIALRPCKESVFKKYKDKGFQTIKEYALDLVKTNKDNILEEIKATKIKQALGNLFYRGFDSDIFATINDSIYDELENVPNFKLLREIYTEDNFNKVEKNVYRYIPEGTINAEELPNYCLDFSDFPMARFVSYVSNNDTAKTLFDYMLLYYKSGEYAISLKKNKEQAA